MYLLTSQPMITLLKVILISLPNCSCMLKLHNLCMAYTFFPLYGHAAGKDYDATTISVVLNNQSRLMSIYVGIIDDNVFETSKTFFGRLSAVGVLPWNIRLEPNITTATIFDDKRMSV